MFSHFCSSGFLPRPTEEGSKQPAGWVPHAGQDQPITSETQGISVGLTLYGLLL